MAASPPSYDEIQPQESTEIALRARVAELEARIAQMESKPADVRQIDWAHVRDVHTLLTPETLSEHITTKEEAQELILLLSRMDLADVKVSHVRQVARVIATIDPKLGPDFVRKMYHRRYRIPDRELMNMLIALRFADEPRIGNMQFDAICQRKISIVLAIVEEFYNENWWFIAVCEALTCGRRGSKAAASGDMRLCRFLCRVRDELEERGAPVDRIPVETLVTLYQTRAPHADVADLLSTTDPAIVTEALSPIKAAYWEMSESKKRSRRKILKAMEKRAAAVEWLSLKTCRVRIWK